MKIIHVCQYYNDGYGYQENILPRYQKMLGHEVMVITSDRKSYFSGEKEPKIVGTGEFIDNGIKIIRLPIKNEFKGRYVRFINLERELEKENPDYIFHHGLIAPSLITCAKYKEKKKSIFLVADNHADFHNSAKNLIWRFFYYKIIQRIKVTKYIKYIDIIFGVTPGRCDFVKKIFKFDEEKIRLLPIGGDVILSKNSIDKIKETRRKYSLKEDDIVIITGGKLNKEKKTHLLIKIVENKKIDNLKLLLFGSVDKEIKKELNFAQKSNFIGWLNREQTLNILAASDCAIWPGLHTTLIEDAISTLTPVIIKFYDSSSHLIKGNGLYLFSSEYKELDQFIDLIIETDIIKNFKKYVKKQRDYFSYENIAKESLNIIRERESL